MSQLTYKQREARAGYLMALPSVVLLLLFVFVPLILGGYWSLTNKRLISPLPTEFIGVDNYDRMLGLSLFTLDPELDAETGTPLRDETGSLVFPRVRSILREDDQYEGFREWFNFNVNDQLYIVLAKDPEFMRSLVNTVLFVLAIVPGQGGLALLLALLVNQKLRGIKFFRTAYFSPIITSMAVIAVVWTFMYNPDQGVINSLLRTVTFGQIDNIPWLISKDTALLSIVIMSAWHSVGFQMVIFLAGLQGIPEEMYEAAEIDGANGWQKFAYVTIPLLRNTIIFVIISTTILAFRIFTQIDIMTSGGPENSTISIIYHIVNQGFRQQRIGYASAMTIVFFVIVLLITLLQRVLLPSSNAMEDA